MRLDNVTVQGEKSTPLVMPRVCVCADDSTEASRLSQPAAGPTCPECGGSRSQAAESAPSERQERRKLQDFLSAFV
jgi:hypothetical protein